MVERESRGFCPDTIGTPETGHGRGRTPLFSGVAFRLTPLHFPPCPALSSLKLYPRLNRAFLSAHRRSPASVVRGTLKSFQKPSRQAEIYVIGIVSLPESSHSFPVCCFFFHLPAIYSFEYTCAFLTFFFFLHSSRLYICCRLPNIQ